MLPGVAGLRGDAGRGVVVGEAVDAPVPGLLEGTDHQVARTVGRGVPGHRRVALQLSSPDPSPKVSKPQVSGSGSLPAAPSNSSDHTSSTPRRAGGVPGAGGQHRHGQRHHDAPNAPVPSVPSVRSARPHVLPPSGCGHRRAVTLGTADHGSVSSASRGHAIAAASGTLIEVRARRWLRCERASHETTTRTARQRRFRGSSLTLLHINHRRSPPVVEVRVALCQPPSVFRPLRVVGGCFAGRGAGRGRRGLCRASSAR